jgi:hypothetical protein
VLYTSNDTITDISPSANDSTKALYAGFVDAVEVTRDAGSDIESGSVTAPNCPRALCTGDWKLVRYVDLAGVALDEWELYCLKTDPIEAVNLVDFRTGEVRDDVSALGMTKADLVKTCRQLKKELARQEADALCSR